MDYKCLFTSPFKIGKMKVKNRIVMSPMGLNAAHPDGRIDDDEIHYFEERARGGGRDPLLWVVSSLRKSLPEAPWKVIWIRPM